jgi:CPA2 family monovalent cation:H+ antiporter-2
VGIAADISLIVVFGLLFGAIAHRLGQPLLLGSIAAGILLGPHTGFITISDYHEIELLAEIGIALLLFSIGIEFSFDSLKSVRRVALAGTAIQMGLTGLLGFALGNLFGLDRVESMWLGALVSVSSTMVVLKTLAGSGVMGTLSSRVMLGMLIAQDLAVIPLMIVMPQVSGPSIDWVELALAIGRAAIVLLVLVAGGRRVVPWLMHRVVNWGSRELFVLTVITLGLGIGYLSHLLGLSYALGAFVAGLVLSESDYGHQALSDVIPLRDLFGLLFFATVGMLFDPGFLVRHAAQVSILALALLVGKGLLFGGVTRLFGYRYIVPLATALTMGQIGEFSFLLAQIGRKAGAIGEELHSLVISGAVVTMVLTPYLSRLAGPVYRWQRRRTKPATVAVDSGDSPSPDRPVVIAGAGRVGRRIARLLSTQAFEVVLIDFDHRRVDAARDRGYAVVFGDAAREPVLSAAGIERARLALVTVPTAVDSLAVASRIRALAPEAPLFVRTDALEERDELLKLDAIHIVQPEFEAALELAREAMEYLGVEDGVSRVALKKERTERFVPEVAHHTSAPAPGGRPAK